MSTVFLLWRRQLIDSTIFTDSAKSHRAQVRASKPLYFWLHTDECCSVEIVLPKCRQPSYVILSVIIWCWLHIKKCFFIFIWRKISENSACATIHNNFEITVRQNIQITPYRLRFPLYFTIFWSVKKSQNILGIQ